MSTLELTLEKAAQDIQASEVNKYMKQSKYPPYMAYGLGLIFVAICIATDINDDLFLPLALGCAVIGLVLNFLLQREARRKSRPEDDESP